MLNKARRKFILWSMVSLIVIVAVLISVINIVNNRQVNARLDTALEEIAMNNSGKTKTDDGKDEEDGKTHKGDGTDGSSQTNPYDDIAPDEADISQSDPYEDIAPDGDDIFDDYEYEPDGSPNDKPGKTDHGRSSAMIQYGSRYFIVLFNLEGEADDVLQNQDNVSEEDAFALANSAAASGRHSGYINEYKYMMSGDKSMVFLDCSTDFSAMESLLLMSVLVGIAGIILAFVFIIFVSKKIVEPVRVSIEKQKQFITNAGHELKTPLSAIATNMDILSMDIGKNEWVTGTQKQVSKLRKLVENLVSLSKIEEDDNIPEMMVISVSDIVQECLDSFEGIAMAQGKQIDAQVTDGLKVNGDPGLMQQLISILCDNAVKYSSGPEAIEVRLHRDGKTAVFETANNWEQNVDNDKLDQLFERFYRGDPARNPENKSAGHGLGLSIAMAMAEKNKAKLTVSTDERGWIVFRLQMKAAD